MRRRHFFTGRLRFSGNVEAIKSHKYQVSLAKLPEGLPGSYRRILLQTGHELRLVGFLLLRGVAGYGAFVAVIIKTHCRNRYAVS